MGAVRQLEYFRIGQETTWATAASSFTGIAPDEWSVGIENQISEQDKHTGEIDSVYTDIVAQDLKGSYVSQMWPDNISLLLGLAGLPRQSNGTQLSYTLQCYDKAKNEYFQQTGLKGDSVEITASGSDPKVKWNYDLIGCAETVLGSTFTKPTLPSGPAFEFHDGAFTIQGAAEANVTEFSISIKNNLIPSDPRDSSRLIKWIDEGRRNIEVTWTVRTDSTLAAHYMNLARSRERAATFVVAFNYPGTGSPVDTLTLTLGALVIKSVVRTGSVGDVQTLAISATARKPAATDAIVVATT
jgi:hypothetical protein